MHLLRYPKLELPTYAEDEVAWTSGAIRLAAQSDRSEFVRRTCLTYNGSETELHKVLTLADLVLEQVCDYVGVTSIGYSWGLAPISESTRNYLGDRYYDNDHGLLPEDFALVACVKNIKGARPLSAYWQYQIRELDPSGMAVMAEDGSYVSNYDIGSPGQFVHMPPLGDNDLHGSPILVDMEPRLLVRQSI